MSAQLTRQEKSRQLMGQAPVGAAIVKMAVPTIIAFLINSIYSLADTYFVSTLGVNATAAVTVNASLDQLIMMCGSMLAVGANSYIARLLGEGNPKKASQVLSTAFFVAFGIGALLLVFGSIFMEEMMTLLGATPTCLNYSVDYATYVLLAAPFMATSFVMNQCLRSEGSAVLSMVGMSFGGVLNVLLDYLMVPGNAALGIPAMGVTGAVVDIPIFMPLIGFDKEEIVTIARKIGTMETSILPYEDCCTVFLPKHPTTKPKLERILEAESVLDIEGLVEAAVKAKEVINIFPE